MTGAPHALRRVPGTPSLGLAPDLARLPITRDLRALSLAEGVRAALSVSVIIAASEYLGWPILRESALAALLTCLCDPGGPIRRRVPVLLSFAVLGAFVSGGLGLLRGLGPVVALPIGVLGLFAASFARVYGQAAQQVGALLGVVIILSLDQALSPAVALPLSGAFVLGALWAIVLTMVIWRQHPFYGARQAVAESYRNLASLAADLYRLLCSRSTEEEEWARHARSHRRAVRDAIESARSVVVDTVRSRGAASPRASQLLIRLETADQLFGALIALGDLLERGSTGTGSVAKRLLRRLPPLLTVLAGVALTDAPDRHPGLGRSINAMTAEAARLPDNDPLRAVMYTVIERLRIAYTLAVPANYVPGTDLEGRRLALRQRLLGPPRANLVWRSPTLRHAARAALTAAPGLVLTMAWFTPYDHWLTITIFATMQPFFAVTYARALERTVGTALGGIIAAIVGLLCTTPFAITVAMFPLAIAAMAVRAVNFGLFMLTLTPLVVLLVETGAPATSEWRIALARAVFTTVGGLVAVASSFLLWPTREPKLMAAEVRDAIAAHGRYAEAELSYLLSDSPVTAVEAARRAAGVAINILEASISRALLEPGSDRGRLEAALVADAALRRCAGRLSAMQLDRGLTRLVPPSSLRAWRDWIGGAMRTLAAGESVVPPRPEAVEVDALQRLARQVELLAGAMQRLSA